jgi:hypothetical protein
MFSSTLFLGENTEQEGEASTSGNNQTATDDGKLLLRIILFYLA